MLKFLIIAVLLILLPAQSADSKDDPRMTKPAEIVVFVCFKSRNKCHWKWILGPIIIEKTGLAKDPIVHEWTMDLQTCNNKLPTWTPNLLAHVAARFHKTNETAIYSLKCRLSGTKEA